VETGKLLRKLEGNTLPVYVLAFSPDGQLFATAGAVQRGGKCESVEVLLWDMATGKRKNAFPDQTLPVNSLAFSPDGSTLAIGEGNGFYGGPTRLQAAPRRPAGSNFGN
jgi:WD40 repeat protein